MKDGIHLYTMVLLPSPVMRTPSISCSVVTRIYVRPVTHTLCCVDMRGKKRRVRGEEQREGARNWEEESWGKGSKWREENEGKERKT